MFSLPAWFRADRTEGQEMELDHIFLFVRNEEPAQRMMADAGLRVNYTRHHPGQGTTNLCACLDDMFFELLFYLPFFDLYLTCFCSDSASD